MHEIESLVESSVITVATASPIPPLARNICFNLYQLQNQLDCGYTVLRVREELEKLGYLFLLPPEQLPEPERSAALKLNEEGGFLSDGTYFDHRSGRCCVTAGSLLNRQRPNFVNSILWNWPNLSSHWLQRCSPGEIKKMIIMLMPLIRWDFGMPFSPYSVRWRGWTRRMRRNRSESGRYLKCWLFPNHLKYLRLMRLARSWMTLKKKKCLFSPVGALRIMNGRTRTIQGIYPWSFANRWCISSASASANSINSLMISSYAYCLLCDFFIECIIY